MEDILKKYLGCELFNEYDIDYIEKLTFQNVALLSSIDSYEKADDRLEEIREKIEELHSLKIITLFDEFEELVRKNISIENCLAYYIGLAKGINIGKIKELK